MSKRPTIIRTPMTEAERDSVAATVRLYESVVADLKEVLQHGWPSKELLEAEGAPLLEDWHVSSRHVPNLEGNPVGHPLLDGWTRTSPLHALSVEAGVARTQSRWYRLGDPWKRPPLDSAIAVDIEALLEKGRWP